MTNVRTYGTAPFRIAVVHGGPGAIGDVAPVAQWLGRSRGVFEPLQSAETLWGQVEELADVVRRHGEAPVFLVGHSWGAWLCCLVAARYSELTQKLVLVSSGPFEEQYAQEIAAARLKRLSTQDRAEYLDVVDRVANAPVPNDAVLARLGALALKADSYDLIEHASDGAGIDVPAPSAGQFQRVWPEAAALRREGKLLRLVSTITCPVVAIHGAEDSHPVAGVRDPLARALADFRMIVLDTCGHYPWRERLAREAFFRVLEAECTGAGGTT